MKCLSPFLLLLCFVFVVCVHKRIPIRMLEFDSFAWRTEKSNSCESDGSLADPNDKTNMCQSKNIGRAPWAVFAQSHVYEFHECLCNFKERSALTIQTPPAATQLKLMCAALQCCAIFHATTANGMAVSGKQHKIFKHFCVICFVAFQREKNNGAVLQLWALNGTNADLFKTYCFQF